MNMFKSNGGFTLVELVVVIAILAILAGVAVPAYSGYISKANQAADDAQIVVINQAIDAACAMNGKTSADATVTVTGNAVTAIAIAGDNDAALEDKVLSDYNTFIAGNTISALKYYSGLAADGGHVKGAN